VGAAENEKASGCDYDVATCACSARRCDYDRVLDSGGHVCLLCRLLKMNVALKNANVDEPRSDMKKEEGSRVRLGLFRVFSVKNR
jgi:hypothetical protein